MSILPSDKRKEKWSFVETDTLQKVIKNSTFMKNGKFLPDIDSQRAWEEIASVYNSQMRGSKKTADQVKGKWYNDLKRIFEDGETATGGGSSSAEPSTGHGSGPLETPPASADTSDNYVGPVTSSDQRLAKTKEMDDLCREKTILEIQYLKLKIKKLNDESS